MRFGIVLVSASLASVVALPLAAQTTRQLGPHVHGESRLAIAAEGRTLKMELHAPGADIVGFEHMPSNNTQRAAIAAATATLSDPIGLFGIPAAAQCVVTKVEVSLVEEEEEAAQAPAGGASPGALAAAPPPAPARPAAPAAEMHTEFEATYELTCANLAAITGLNFAFFAKFRNAGELDVELATARGTFSFEVPRAKPAVSTRNMF
jgi:hypothetical protein